MRKSISWIHKSWNLLLLYFFILNKYRAQLCQLTKHLHVCHVGDAQIFVAITDFMHKTKSLNHAILKNPTLAFLWFYNLQQTQTFFFNSRKVSNPFCLIKTSEKHQLAAVTGGASQMEACRGSEVHLQWRRGFGIYVHFYPLFLQSIIQRLPRHSFHQTPPFPSSYWKANSPQTDSGKHLSSAFFALGSSLSPFPFNSET